MSHLSLDARAILEYLNELGYRNISAEQLKEFMKGMQPQSENNNIKQKTTVTTTSTSNKQQQALPTTTLQLQQQQQQSNRKHHHHHHHHTPKIIKGKRPLSNFKFYLDIRDHQLTKKIEDQIALLGGILEFFLSEGVTHFVTDKSVLPPPAACNNNNTLSSRPGTPQTPGTPHTPYTTLDQQPNSPYESNLKNVGAISNVSAKKQSRADAMLNRARRQSTTAASTPTSLVQHEQQQQLPNSNNNNNLSQQQPYIIWQAEYALRFFKRITHDLKGYLEATNNKKFNGKSRSSSTVEPITLKGGFIKIEAIKRNQRPYYQLFRKPAAEWPKIELDREDGAFRLSPKKKEDPLEDTTTLRHNLERQDRKMTRKSRSRSSHRGQTSVKKASNAGLGGTQQKCKQVKQETSEKQCGVCEICKIEYDTLTIHLKTKDHEYFARNSQNFIALDTLIHTSADVNKFLDSNKELEDNEEKSELEEEMEVAESTGPLDTDVPDPLEDTSITGDAQLHHRAQHGTKQRYLVYSPVKTPSPTLREKSKRSTKGKHSSEKFQNTVAAVKSTPKSASSSPQKKPGCLSISSNALELQKIKREANAATMGRRKSIAAVNQSAVSPPIRAMLPPSSLYKVVETTTGGNCTPPRKTRDAVNTAATASPSLIVKFRKVRQTELAVLNGEAENFMFPKVRAPSELPTDVDRQTTSENNQMSSTSLDSSNSADSHQMDVDSEPPSSPGLKMEKSKNIATLKKVIAVAKRNKSGSNSKQSFPRTPIQPELTTPKSNRAVEAASSTATAATALRTAGITLPEATRKSSRTATAIVTAATTSSRLLRAAVEAAKNNMRLDVTANRSICKTNNSRRLSCSFKTTPTLQTTKQGGISRRRTTALATVVQLEDRMGDNEDSGCNTFKSERKRNNKMTANLFHGEDDDDSDDEEEDDDDDDDEDYVHNMRGYNKLPNLSLIKNRKSCPAFTTRDQRAANRATHKFIEEEEEAEIKSETEEIDVKPNPKANTAVPESPDKSAFAPIKKTSLHRNFDFRKSEHIPKMTYAFERLPTSDLWYRVFNRQDNCEEQIFEYYGSTKYRKLPYELGPIPFDCTLDGVNCKLCGKGGVAGTESDTKNIEKPKENVPATEDEKQNSNKNNHKVAVMKRIETTAAATTTTQTTAPSSPSPSCTASSSNFTHKKLHLLQRYRQEQQELLQRQEEKQKQQQLQQQQLKTGTAQNERKSSTPDREPHERACSINSNASSYASSCGTMFSKKFPRNKHLNKAAFLSLELPPRKSPREHASTLALVSCIIKQRQDSQSKPNSETDEPPNTPTPPTLNDEELKPCPLQISNAPNETPPLHPTAIRSPRTTRSAAATPVEELRFATEISENVKRLRRGQNKYDHSPTVFVNKNSKAALPLDNTNASASASANVDNNGSAVKKKGRPRKYPLQINKTQAKAPIKLKRRRRQMDFHSYTTSSSIKFHHHSSSYNEKQNKLPSIRKTGSKKGVLEYEVDSAALNALEASKEYTSVRLLEWEIDKYLQIAGRDYDIDEKFAASLLDPKSISEELVSNDPEKESKTTNATTATNSKVCSPTKRKSQVQITVTPPTTDYFSSDFDLYDLFICTQQDSVTIAPDQDQPNAGSKNPNFSLYNSVALQNYFKKRKNIKCNRTGWPKAQRKKTSVRQQQKLNEKISFLKAISTQPIDVNGDGLLNLKHLLDEENVSKDKTRESEVVTPPDSYIDDDEKASTLNDDEDDVEDTEHEAADSIPEEDETIMDSIDREADVEENDDDDADGGVEEDENDDIETSFEPQKKRTRRSTATDSHAEKLMTATTMPASSCRLDVLTSTPPTQQLLRNLRRTPQLNGSLGSCISPSEKAGDNSDIFTVSSDGLDTDLDLSNSHSQLRSGAAIGCINAEDHDYQHEHCVNHTPKKKFDLGKYASNNVAAASTCAAEAVTMTPKSLAISQFLKKEVKVQCRRLRAPFRRFRYRR